MYLAVSLPVVCFGSAIVKMRLCADTKVQHILELAVTVAVSLTEVKPKSRIASFPSVVLIMFPGWGSKYKMIRLRKK